MNSKKNIVVRFWVWICSIPGRIKNSIENYRLRHLCIGKPKFRDDKLYIEKISWDVHWQTKWYLSAIIRDYLKVYLKEACGMPMSLYVNNTEGLDYSEALEKIPEETIMQRWREKMEKTINLFDKLAESEDGDFEKMQINIDEAFDALKEVFFDLDW